MTTSSTTDPGEVVVLVGNPRPGSRTADVALRAAAALGATAPTLLDLADLLDRHGTPFGADAAQRWREPLDRLLSARLLVVATPTYKGSYTGLLKSVLDHVEAGALRAAVAVPVLTVGGPAHTLAADVHLRPLLVELGASTPTSALVVGAADLDDPADAVARWVDENSAVLARLGAAPERVPA